MPEGPNPAGLETPDDETLVRLARQGSRPAIEELFHRHRGVAYRVAYRLLGHEEDALDAVQDGLLKAYSGLGEFDGRSGFRTWLARIVSNAAIDLGRKRGRRLVFGVGLGTGAGASQCPPEPAAEDDPALGLRRADLRKTLDLALGRLRPKMRVTFVLFAEAGLSYKEIAEAEGIAIGTVMSRIHAARQKLQADEEIQGLGDLE